MCENVAHHTTFLDLQKIRKRGILDSNKFNLNGFNPNDTFPKQNYHSNRGVELRQFRLMCVFRLAHISTNNHFKISIEVLNR